MPSTVDRAQKSSQVATASPQVLKSPTKGTKVKEEDWAMEWVRGSFDKVSGASIEQGEMYRMYCNARCVPHILSSQMFLQCVMYVRLSVCQSVRHI